MPAVAVCRIIPSMRDCVLGIVDFSTALFCAKDALGQPVDISVGGHAGILTLPSLPDWKEKEEDPLHEPLLGPIRARTWKRGDTLIHWGMPWSFPGGDAGVERALMEFQIRDNHETAAQQIYGGFYHWLKLFEQYVTLFTTQNTRSYVIGGEVDRIQLFTNNHNKLAAITRTGPINISIELSQEDDALHLPQLKEVCRLSSLALPPRLEYRMMLEAYQARRNADYRKAIIEAATALEICLTERALAEFSAQGILFGTQLLKKFRMLSGRFELVQLLGIPLPNKDYKSLRRRSQVGVRGLRRVRVPRCA